MKDIFLDYNLKYQEYITKKDLYDNLNAGFSSKIESGYAKVIGIESSEDLANVEKMDYGDYISSVCKELKKAVYDTLNELKNLEVDLLASLNECNNIGFNLMCYSKISFEGFLLLLRLFNINYKDVLLYKNTNNEEVMKVSIFDGEKYDFYTFLGNGISLVSIINGEIVFNSIAESFIGSDFIRYYINYLYSRGICHSIYEAFEEYGKLEENKLV